MNPSRRVVITGFGSVSPLGLSTEALWKNIKAGRSGISRISLFETDGFPVQIAGEVRGLDAKKEFPADEALQKSGRGTVFAVRAAEEAVAMSGLDFQKGDPERYGIFFGSGDSGNNFPGFCRALHESRNPAAGRVDFTKYLQSASRYLKSFEELEIQPSRTLAHLARRFGIQGPVANTLTACAASSQAIGEGSEWIRRGDADVVISGGAHAMVYPLALTGFSLLTALSPRNAEPERASRPFDKNRDGFVMAEGAGVVILEALEHALKRGAVIYGELAGYGSTGDAYRMTDMDPEGKGACRAMEIALRKAGLTPSDVGYINAHGTATQVNDAIETLVIKKVMGENAYRIPVSSIKSMLGHMIAAAGAVELIACLLAIRDQLLPPTINYEEPDPACDLDYVPNKAREASVKAALSNSFGFGGQNICLAVKRYE